jgi:hypothetical protein
MGKNILRNTSLGAPCVAGGSLIDALRRAITIICREFDLTYDVSDFPGKGKVDCSTIRVRWKEASSMLKEKLTKTRNGRRARKFDATIKSCNRIFDVPCFGCDLLAANKASEEWMARVDEDPVFGNLISQLYTERLKRNVRELTGGWGKRLEQCRKDAVEPITSADVYVPDTQGCLETTMGEGGTLGTSDSECAGDSSLVRLGVAKTKGKHRVVTMQSARVKRTLRPVHNALYDHLSSFDWLVRGDVRKEDFVAVSDAAKMSKEWVISGDYKEATNNIYLPAVEAIVDVLSEDPYLTESEKTTLVSSFRSLRYQVGCCKIAEKFPINRGSMMGNLVSFPLLCILNKACHDIACEEVYGMNVKRIGRFNGDDCCFPGSKAMYMKWRHVTSLFGLIVNEDKTEFSNRWIDLNSQSFDIRRQSLCAKPGLSFLTPRNNKPGEILTGILSQVKTFKPAVQQWIVNVVMRHEIEVKGFAFSNLDKFWRRHLVKKKWFRRLALQGPATLKAARFRFDEEKLEKKEKRGVITRVDRNLEQVQGPPPVAKYLDVIHLAIAGIEKERVRYWTGKKVTPLEMQVDRPTFYQTKKERYTTPLPRTKYLGFRTEWTFLWPRVLLEYVLAKYPDTLLSEQRRRFKTYPGFSPYLSLSCVLLVEKPRVLNYPPPLSLTARPPPWIFLSYSSLKRMSGITYQMCPEEQVTRLMDMTDRIRTSQFADKPSASVSYHTPSLRVGSSIDKNIREDYIKMWTEVTKRSSPL